MIRMLPGRYCRYRLGFKSEFLAGATYPTLLTYRSRIFLAVSVGGRLFPELAELDDAIALPLPKAQKYSNRSSTPAQQLIGSHGQLFTTDPYRAGERGSRGAISGAGGESPSFLPNIQPATAFNWGVGPLPAQVTGIPTASNSVLAISPPVVRCPSCPK